LFVDRSRTAEARTVVDQHAPPAADVTPAPEPEPATARRELDEDAEWRRIVAAFEAEHGPAVVDERPLDAPPPPPHELPVLDQPDEHYEPPPPPPIPAPAPASLYAVLLVAAGVLLIGAPGILNLSADLGLVIGVAGIAGGVAMLVSRMRDRSDDDGDDGAVV
jgi:hypothetical protein